MPGKSRGRNRGFSLLELVIVVTIIGILAAIAIPRFSRGAAGAADTALVGNLSVLRNAIDMFAAEHGGSYPTEKFIVEQLTQYSDVTGDKFSTTRDSTCLYGPYVRKIPALPVGEYKGQTGIAAISASTVGWIYDEGTGAIRANTSETEKDASGTLYSEY